MTRSPGATCDATSLTFELADPGRGMAGVRLHQDIGLPADQLEFEYHREGGCWRLRVPRPAVWRVEYRLELRRRDGTTEVVCDPGNPRRVGNTFGDRSVLECPEYRRPWWLEAPPAAGTWRELPVSASRLGGPLTVRAWSPPDPTGNVLLAHDGADYDRFASLGRYSAAMISTGRVRPHHLVLLSAADRNEWYSADPAYARALNTEVLPAIHAQFGGGRLGGGQVRGGQVRGGQVRGGQLSNGLSVVGLGASLGGLAMLHAHRRHPDTFVGLCLQSGSFFRPCYDRHEAGFRRYVRLVRFVGRVVRGLESSRPVPTVLTCGRVEENRYNNREMAEALRRQGYPATLVEVPDAHNFVGWRDCLDPHLTGLLCRVWGPGPQPGPGPQAGPGPGTGTGTGTGG